MPLFDMLTLTAAAELIRTRKISPVEITRECLARIERLEPTLNAFITVTAELAMEQAKIAEQEIMRGDWRGPLHGIPIALKDLIDTAGVPTTAASNQLHGRMPTQDAQIVRQLKQAGAVVVGKNNLHEFAFGGSGAISAYGPTKNPWDGGRITGGSSSGSAAAVASGMCVAAIGTDTGGSIRCPAALCGITGYRPGWSGLSRYSEHLGQFFSLGGVIPLSRSFDTVGPLTRTALDAAMVLDVFAHLAETLPAKPAAGGFKLGVLSRGKQPKREIGRRFITEDVSGMVAAIPRAGWYDGLAPEIEPVIEDALKVVRSMVKEVREIELPMAGRGKIFSAEVYEYHEAMLASSPEKYQPGTLARLQGCAGVTATEYVRDVRALEQTRARLAEELDGVDVVVVPTVPVTAPTFEELAVLDHLALRNYETQVLLRNTLPFNALHWAAVSVPCGFTAQGLPVGLQFATHGGRDVAALSLAHAYESATEWHKREPAL